MANRLAPIEEMTAAPTTAGVRIAARVDGKVRSIDLDAATAAVFIGAFASALARHMQGHQS